MRTGFTASIVAIILSASTHASTPLEKSREERLLEILLEREIITETEFQELRGLDLEADDAPNSTPPAFDLERVIDEIVSEDLEEASSALAGYDGGFWIHDSERFGLRINGRVQMRYTFTDFDPDSGLDDTSDFGVDRVRLDFRGHAFDPMIRYRVQIDPAEDPADGVNALRDAYLQWNHETTGAAIRAGQFKTPFGRQWITDADRFQLVDRSDPARFFTFGRDVGAMLHGSLLDSRLEYAAAVFNGTGTGGVNDGNDHLWVGRVVFDPFGPFDLFEGDPERSEDFGISVGANYALRNLSEAQGMTVFGAMTEADESSLGIDAQLRFLGFSLLGEVFTRTTEEDDDLGFEDIDDTGFYVQGGYFLLDRLEVAARYSSRNREDDNVGADDDTEEITVGLGYYLAGHGHKVQLDYTQRNFEPEAGGDLEDRIVRLQWLLAF